MIRLAVVGVTGRLGRRVVRCAAASGDVQVTAALVRAGHDAVGRDLGEVTGGSTLGVRCTSIDDGVGPDVDVILDVSLPEGTERLLQLGGDVAFVTGVTGLPPATLEAIERASTERAVLVASNFSVGVAVLEDLVTRAARALPDASVEIVETHHTAKQDAPSGTALHLAGVVASTRGQGGDAIVHGRSGRTGARGDEIAVHALRLGDVVGEHTVWLGLQGERVCLGHVASSRDTFALGALRAARWMVGRAPGAYTMRHVLQLDPS